MTTGASSDFEEATKIATYMVVSQGFSDEIGPMVVNTNKYQTVAGMPPVSEVHKGPRAQCLGPLPPKQHHICGRFRRLVPPPGVCAICVDHISDQPHDIPRQFMMGPTCALSAQHPIPHLGTPSLSIFVSSPAHSACSHLWGRGGGNIQGHRRHGRFRI